LENYLATFDSQQLATLDEVSITSYSKFFSAEDISVIKSFRQTKGYGAKKFMAMYIAHAVN